MLLFYVTFILFAMLTPTMAYAFLEEKKEKPRNLIFTFSSPDGSKKQLKVKMGYSWSVALTLLIPGYGWLFLMFRGSAFLFRGQFIQWLGASFGIMILLSIALGFIIVDLDSSGALEDDVLNISDIPEWWTDISAGSWIGVTTMFLLIGALNTYFVLFANKSRIKSLHKKGFSFDNALNGDVSDVYEYIGLRKSLNSDDLSPNIKRGASHDYVVPENPVVEEDVSYDGLTTQDLKLLLKSEGVPFHGESDREEILELVEEYIAAPDRAEKEKERLEKLKSIYKDMTIEELVEELKARKISYDSDMTKSMLIILLVKDHK